MVILSLPTRVVDCPSKKREIDAVVDGNSVVIVELLRIVCAATIEHGRRKRG